MDQPCEQNIDVAGQIAEPDRILETPQPRPWPFWPAFGFSCIIGAVVLTVSVIICVVFIVTANIHSPRLDIPGFAESLQYNGLFFALTTLITAPLVVGMAMLFVRMRKNITTADYLALNKTSARTIVKWSLLMLIFAAGYDVFTLLIGRSIISPTMLTVYQSARSPVLLWLAVIIAAPLSEEIFFRGFLFKTLLHSKAGVVGTIIFTSLFWTALHTQYGPYELANIFTWGIVLAIARLRTNSIYPPIAMHVLINLIATIEMIIYIKMA